MAFILQPSGEVMRRILLLQSEKIQIVSSLADSNKIEALGQDLLKNQFVDYVFPCDPVKIYINTLFENLSLGKVYLSDRESMQTLLDYASAFLIDGRLPQKNREIVVDELYAINQQLALGDILEGQLKIVGILKSGCYLLAGLNDPKDSGSLAILSSGKDISFSQIIEDLGYNANDFIIEDNVSRSSLLQKYADTEYRIYFIIKTAAVIVTILCLMGLFGLYIRDRQSELCFYYSIGFSKKDIYLSVLKKLLFIFGAAILIGFGLSLVAFALIKHFIIMPLGLIASLHLPHEILHCFSCLFLIFASLQLALFFAMQKINTIDLLEEEWV
jgi:ABC-type antimicrobial peptide transport system permease subunit